MKEIRCRADRSHNQTCIIIGRWAALALADEAKSSSDPWSEETVSMASEFYEKHLNVAALKVLGFVYGMEGNRETLIEQLLEVKARPYLVDVLKSWYSRVLIMALGGTDPGIHFTPPGGGDHDASIAQEREEGRAHDRQDREEVLRSKAKESKAADGRRQREQLREHRSACGSTRPGGSGHDSNRVR